MTRIRFEDLPSTDTPINAAQLDKLNNVVISPTEPTTGEEVWIQKSNNLIEVDSSLSVTLSTDIICNLKKGTYTIAVDEATSTGGSYESYIGFKNAAGGTFFYAYLHYGTKELTFTLEQDVVSIAIWSQKYWDISKGVTTTFTNLRIVSGDEVLPYDTYTPRKIYIKNDNGVYEEIYDETNLEIYSTSEQRIGTWIDGKPLYRRVYNCGQLTNGGQKETPTNLYNVNYIDWECIAIASGGSVGYPLKMAHTGNDYAAKVEIVGNVIRITINADLSEYTGYATILYTKN